ncbi:MAG: hypothetical protein L0Y56_09000 [Nitrospira sp.]|nr:hypothetical protein [Nitrospira sp.]
MTGLVRIIKDQFDHFWVQKWDGINWVNILGFKTYEKARNHVLRSPGHFWMQRWIGLYWINIKGYFETYDEVENSLKPGSRTAFSGGWGYWFDSPSGAL